MNKKLRLLVTTRCPNKCPMCCNNQFDFNKLPVVDRWNYDEIMITGGEPLLFGDELPILISSIKYLESMQGSNPSKIYVYTASCGSNYINILPYVDGIVLTPHNKIDIEHFVRSNE